MSNYPSDENFEYDLNGQDAIIHLVLDDDTEMQCVVVAVFQAEDTNYEYIALLPIDETIDSEESDVLLYRYAEDEDGELILDNIVTDEEYDAAAKAFYEIVSEMSDDEEEEDTDE